jgi:hypothetical protein
MRTNRGAIPSQFRLRKMRSLILATVGFYLSVGIAGSVRPGRGLSPSQPHSDSATLPVMDTARLTIAQHEIKVEEDRHLNLVCVGSGAPTILFESGTGGAAYDWRFVQAAVAQKTTACSYDRAGFGSAIQRREHRMRTTRSMTCRG